MQCLFLGLLAAVENLTVHSHPSFVLLTWVRPFSLDITGVDPDLWYCVEVYNITWGRAPLTTNCSVYEPHFYFTAPNPSPCDLFEFTVFAVNAVRNGSVASVNGTFFKSKCRAFSHLPQVCILCTKLYCSMKTLGTDMLCCSCHWMLVTSIVLVQLTLIH